MGNYIILVYPIYIRICNMSVRDNRPVVLGEVALAGTHFRVRYMRRSEFFNLNDPPGKPILLQDKQFMLRPQI